MPVSFMSRPLNFFEEAMVVDTAITKLGEGHEKSLSSREWDAGHVVAWNLPGWGRRVKYDLVRFLRSLKMIK